MQTRNKSSFDVFRVPAAESAPRQFVQFYEHDDFLVNGVTQFAASGLEAGERVLIIATRAHRQAIFDQLLRRRLKFPRLFAPANYIEVDAASALSNFMIDGRPDPERFQKLIGGYLRDESGPIRVRAFGEMVALLWAQGNQTGAIALERLWNQLVKDYSVSLFCAYPMSNFAEVSEGTELLRVCSEGAGSILSERFGGTDRNAPLI